MPCFSRAVTLRCGWHAVVLILRAVNECQHVHFGSKDVSRSLERAVLSFSVVIMFGALGGTTTRRERGRGHGREEALGTLRGLDPSLFVGIWGTSHEDGSSHLPVKAKPLVIAEVP